MSYQNRLSWRNKVGRLLWSACYLILFRPFSLPVFYKWRNVILRIFGAKIGKCAGVHASARVWAPWNLELEDYACIDDRVNVYNVDKVVLKQYATVSFDTLLCTASHNIYSQEHELMTAPILIKEKAWVGAAAFIGMGVTVGEGAVVAASSSVHKDVEPWTIVGGNPAKFIKKHEIK